MENTKAPAVSPVLDTLLKSFYAFAEARKCYFAQFDGINADDRAQFTAEAAPQWDAVGDMLINDISVTLREYANPVTL